MFVSVLVPVRNAAAYIQSCLEQIRKQDFPHESLEVIVVDGSSDDDTVERAKAVALAPISVIVVSLSERGRSQGLNAGIKIAKGDAICRLDVRTRIEPNYISKCAAALRQTGAANVGGLQLPLSQTAVQSAIGLAMSHPFGVGNAQFRVGKQNGFVDTVYLGFFRRDIFDRVGLFDESAGVISEDSDMNQRIRRIGEKVYLDVSIACYYIPRSTLSEQFSLYFRYGGARASNVIKHRSITSVRQLAAPTMIALAIVLAISAYFIPLACNILWGITGLYLAIDIWVATALVFKKRRASVFPFLLLAFPAMHLGWGLGFWKKMLWRDGNARWKG